MSFSKISSPVAKRIWGSPDAILVFFAGGAAEFATIKAVDWLFYTNALPSAPVDRFFETVRFSHKVFFSDISQSADTIHTINRIHKGVENSRGMAIPQWAYRDVLFIIFDYGVRAHTVVFGPMTHAEKIEYFEAVMAFGQAMYLEDLPDTYETYVVQRHRQLIEDYARTPLTDQLFASYRKALGPVRYWFLRLIQSALVPEELREATQLRPNGLVKWLLGFYRYLPGGGNKLRWFHNFLLPLQYAKQLKALAYTPSQNPRKPVYSIEK